MPYYDITYKSPAGSIGIHYAVEAVSEDVAASKSSEMLCYGTAWKPQHFTVIRVVLSENKPLKGYFND